MVRAGSGRSQQVRLRSTAWGTHVPPISDLDQSSTSTRIAFGDCVRTTSSAAPCARHTRVSDFRRTSRTWASPPWPPSDERSKFKSREINLILGGADVRVQGGSSDTMMGIIPSYSYAVQTGATGDGGAERDSVRLATTIQLADMRGEVR